jgi:hypothetical protein
MGTASSQPCHSSAILMLYRVELLPPQSLAKLLISISLGDHHFGRGYFALRSCTT